MITVYPVLSQRMKENNISARELAAVIQVTILSFYLKMLGIQRWTLTEVVKICGFFNTPDAEHLFVRNNNKQQ